MSFLNMMLQKTGMVKKVKTKIQKIITLILRLK